MFEYRSLLTIKVKITLNQKCCKCTQNSRTVFKEWSDTIQKGAYGPYYDNDDDDDDDNNNKWKKGKSV
jgi:hypothetical protein